MITTPTEPRAFMVLTSIMLTTATVAAFWAPPQAEACSIWTTRAGAEIHFPPSENNEPIPFYIQKDGTADLANDDEFTAIQAAMETWSGVVCGDDGPAQVRFQYMGVLDVDPKNFDPGIFRDEKNVITFINDGWPADPSTIAQTRTQWDNDTGEILEFGIALNDEFTDWSTKEGGEPGTFDVQATIMRQIGLIMGLGNSDVPGAVMEPIFTEGDTGKRVLSNDDVAAICDLYAPGRTDWITTPEDAVCTRDDHPSGRPATSNGTTGTSNGTTGGGTSNGTNTSNGTSSTSNGTTSTTPGGVGASCSNDDGCEEGLQCGCPEALGECETSICYAPSTNNDDPGGSSDDDGCAVRPSNTSPLGAVMFVLMGLAYAVLRRRRKN